MSIISYSNKPICWLRSPWDRVFGRHPRRRDTLVRTWAAPELGSPLTTPHTCMAVPKSAGWHDGLYPGTVGGLATGAIIGGALHPKRLHPCMLCRSTRLLTQ